MEGSLVEYKVTVPYSFIANNEVLHYYCNLLFFYISNYIGYMYSIKSLDRSMNRWIDAIMDG